MVCIYLQQQYKKSQIRTSSFITLLLQTEINLLWTPVYSRDFLKKYDK